MRITNHGLIDKVIANVQERMNQMAKVQRQLTSGLQVEKASDDPAAASRIMEYNNLIRRGQQWMRNLDNAITSLQATDSAICQAQEILVQIRARTVEGSNAGLSDENRFAIAKEVDQTLRELLSIAKQKSGNRYIFGGTDTGQPPYRAIEDESGWISEIEVSYEPGLPPLEQITGPGDRIATTLSAEQAFDLGNGESIFTILVDLRQALMNNDTDSIGACLPRIDAASEQLSSMTGLLGSRISSAERLKTQLADFELRYTDQMSSLADVDMVSAVARFQEEQSAYEVALKASAKIIQTSLVNFI